MNPQELAIQSIKKFKTEARGRELYKFTNLERFFESYNPDQKAEEVDLTKYQDEFLPTFLFVNGELRSSPTIEGLTVNETVSAEQRADNALSEFHHGHAKRGFQLELAKNQKPPSTVRVLHLMTRADIQTPTLTVKLGTFAELTLIEETRGLLDSYAQVAETYVTLAEGARLEHVQIDGGGQASLHHGSTWAQVQKDASYRNFALALSGKITRRNLDITLLAAGANGESYELFLTNEDEHCDMNSVINHQAADTTSNQIAKAILAGDSRGVFTGKIYIHPKAQRVASGQLNRNLLLSKKAHVHSQPQLEIFADDVKCSHGSTTGQMSDEELFYFESRGIPAEKARTLLAFGFGLEVVLKIQDRQTQERAELAVMSAIREKYKLGDQQ